MPEYVSDELSWEALKKIKKGEIDKLRLTLHPEISVNHVDKDHKVITDSQGQEHAYDILIMAMGSRAFVPSNAQLRATRKVHAEKQIRMQKD